MLKSYRRDTMLYNYYIMEYGRRWPYCIWVTAKFTNVHMKLYENKYLRFELTYV